MRDRPERIRRARELRAAGWTIRALASELNCSTYTIQRDLEPDAGLEFRRRRRQGVI
jgi:orotate phosphoribosyltransferase-like protein